MEGPESFESMPPSREMMVEMLTNRGIDDTEVKNTLITYVEAQEKITDTIGGPFAHEEVAIHMAELYFDANYREYAIESLDEMEQILMMGDNDEILEKVRETRNRLLKTE